MEIPNKFILGILLLVFFGCKSSKVSSDSTTTKAFELMEAYAKPWVAGIKEGGSGVEYTFVLKMGTIDKISFGSVWVNGQKLTAKIVRYNKMLPNQELISSGDEIKVRCSGEKVANTIIQPPKPIKSEQALISYILNGESIKYVVVDEIEIKKAENRQ